MHLRCSDLGGWLTKIAGQALEMGPNGADRHGAHSVASRSPRTSGPPTSRRRVGDRCRGAPTAPDRARDSRPRRDRPGGPNHRSTDLGRPTATGQPRALPLPRNERPGWPFREDASDPGTSKDASGMREGPKTRKGGLTDWKVFPAGRVDLGRDDLGRRARGGRRAALARWRRESAGKDGSRTYDVPSDLRERGRESPNLWYTLKGASPSLCTAHASVSPSSSGGVVARAVPVSGP